MASVAHLQQCRGVLSQGLSLADVLEREGRCMRTMLPRLEDLKLRKFMMVHAPLYQHLQPLLLQPAVASTQTNTFSSFGRCIEWHTQRRCLRSGNAAARCKELKAAQRSNLLLIEVDQGACCSGSVGLRTTRPFLSACGLHTHCLAS